MFLKMLSAQLYSSVLGHLALDTIVKPPVSGDPSYELHEREKNHVLKTLKERALLVADTFDSIPGMRLNALAGVRLPGIYYSRKGDSSSNAWELLETTVISIVPMSGFGQIPGTYHFRATILPQPGMMNKQKEIHVNFTAKYS